MPDERTSVNPPDAVLLAWIAKHDAPCPACRYNLRGLRTDRCPECGVVFELGLKAAMPGLKPWLASVMLASLGVGLAFLFTVGGLYEFLAYGFVSTWEPLIFLACAAAFGGGVIHMIILVRRRARLWQRSARGLTYHITAAGTVVFIPLATLAAILLLGL